MNAPRSRRVVLDTNVVVSGILSPAGPPGLILELAATRQVELILSSPILAEYREVLLRTELGLNPDTVARWMAGTEAEGHFVVALPWPRPLPDPDDESFLATAAAGSATLVTGNLKHYPPPLRLNVPVLTPREFLNALRSDE